jgi:phospholipase C
MQGFVQSYFDQRRDARNARKIMYYFSPDKLPVLTTLARSFAVFNGWFSSVPGPGRCNHAFAHFGSSFGRVDSTPFSGNAPYASVFDRMLAAGRTAKLYYFDEASSTRAGVNLLSKQPTIFGTFAQFLAGCQRGTLPEYSFIEPNHTDHLGADGAEQLSSDQHPDHHVQIGEMFIAAVYNAIRHNADLWKSTALLVVYDEHGGIYDHVPPPACVPDAPFVAAEQDTGTGAPFAFDRLGVRVPAILISPWIPAGTVVSQFDPSYPGIFEHASIPATVTQHFIGALDNRSPREKAARTFLNLLSGQMRTDSECPIFNLGDSDSPQGSQPDAGSVVDVTSASSVNYQELAGYHSDEPEGQDLLEITREVDALATVLAAKEVDPPLSLGLFGNWGTGKSFFMRQLDRRIRVLQEDAQAAQGDSAFCENIVQITFNAWNYIDTNLWASLTSEIFEGLAAALAKRRGQDSQDQRALVLAAASSSQAVLADAERRKAEAVEALQLTEQRLSALQSNKAAIEASLESSELFNAAYRFAIDQPEVQKYIKDAGKALHLEQVEVAAGDVKSEILELHGLWTTLLFTMRNTDKLWIWIVAPLVALALGWGVTILLRQFPAAGVMGQITAALAAVSGFLAWFLPGARRALGLIQRARNARAQLIEIKRAEFADALNRQRAEMVAKVQSAQRDVDAAAKHASDVTEQLEKLRADRRLADYIRQRNESTDYTKHLGLIARVRTDFMQLSMLLRDVKEEADSEIKRRQKEKDHEQTLFPRIDRIVLYIDDLDRCPEKNVVEVLQAVNLLLAFPLFVVVVGVDPRWLLHSLEQHSVAFSSSKGDTEIPELELLWQSTPLNYLEKIFQIPYTLRPMDSRGFSRLVDALSSGPAPVLSSGTGSAPGATTAAIDSAAAATSAEAANVAESSQATVEQSVVINRKPEHLRIEPWEKSFMKLLHELIPSPRAGKRFINIYRLIRASVDDRERSVFVGDTKGGEYQCALLLLAILTGHPGEATEVLRELIHHEHKETWWAFIENLKALKLTGPADSAETDPTPTPRDNEEVFQRQRWTDLFGKLDHLRTSINDQPCAAFTKWSPRIARYSFQSGRVLFNAS